MKAMVRAQAWEMSLKSMENNQQDDDFSSCMLSIALHQSRVSCRQLTNY